jgi:predicted phage baseplate assembly protein
MPLPEPILDDLRFQKDLVDEARRRIIRYCPEWTDYNLSDPGITLIELFAWMTEQLTYRLNQVPEKNRIRFMDLMGIRLQPASSARVELTFRLSASFPISPEDTTTAMVPQGLEVATRQTDEEPEVIFTTDERLVIVPPRLTQMRREQNFNKNYLARMGIEAFPVFGQPPRLGDTYYLGFDESQDLRGHILRLEFQCEETQATGVKRNDPPLVWECSLGDGQWRELPPSTLPSERDTTGGLNNPAGEITFYLPLNIQPDQVHGRKAYWLRCRLEQRRKEQGMYSQSPLIRNIAAYSLGATTWGTHAVIVRDEALGSSSGEPGQIFRLQHVPALALREGEYVEVEEKREGETVFVPWQPVTDFSNSDRYDRHFSLDTATGEIMFGPALRQRDGTVRQYGRIPEAGRRLRINRYRYGGGTVGNVPAHKIDSLKSAVPYIDRVTNLARAEGGRDSESLDEAKLRAQREVRAQQRAVTAEDFEYLAKGASRSVARVKCVTPDKSANVPSGMIELLVVPAVFDALQARDLTKLPLDLELVKTMERHLDQYRLLTTMLRIRAPQYIGVKVEAEIVVAEYSQPEAVQTRVLQTLQHYLCPLKLGADNAALQEIVGPLWEGWPFGKTLFVSEIFTLLQKVPGVKHVLEVRLSQRPVRPDLERPPASDDEEGQARPALAAETPALAAVEQRRFEIPPDALLCSLEHEVKVVDL